MHNSRRIKTIVRVLPPDALAEDRQQDRRASFSTVPLQNGVEVKLKLTNESDPAECKFVVDSLLPTKCDQGKVFADVADSAVVESLEGINCAILAYGQSGSGKTYSMIGPVDNPESADSHGLVPRIARSLLQSEAANISFCIFELYQEQIGDLTKKSNVEFVSIKTGAISSIYKHVTLHPLRTYDEFLAILRRALAARKTAETNLNYTSSRSHMLIQFSIQNVSKNTYSTLTCGDLAGSENISRSGATGSTRSESIAINLSLTTLTQIVGQLQDRTNFSTAGIPFRQSTLTRILEPALSGNSVTKFLITIRSDDYDASKNSLLFAVQLGKIKTRPTVNTKKSIKVLEEEVSSLQALVAHLRLKITSLESEVTLLRKLCDDNKIHVPSVVATNLVRYNYRNMKGHDDSVTAAASLTSYQSSVRVEEIDVHSIGSASMEPDRKEEEDDSPRVRSFTSHNLPITTAKDHPDNIDDMSEDEDVESKVPIEEEVDDDKEEEEDTQITSSMLAVPADETLGYGPEFIRYVISLQEKLSHLCLQLQELRMLPKKS